MSADVVSPAKMYDTYPYSYERHTMFNPPSSDLAGYRALFESNSVGGGNWTRKKLRSSRKIRGGNWRRKKLRSSRKGTHKRRRQNLYYFN